MTYDTPEEAIAAARDEVGVDDLIDFDGKNCDDCPGWNGESHRCVCGNRRVYWETNQNSDGKFYAYAAAY